MQITHQTRIHGNTGGDGAGALRACKEHQGPNLIVLAWRFRESQMSAMETLVALKADDILRKVPVIARAAHLPPLLIEELYAGGVACVFRMPTESQALEEVWRDVKSLAQPGAASILRISRRTRGSLL